MAAAIVDLELVEGIPDVADLEPYTRAFVILRYSHRQHFVDEQNVGFQVCRDGEAQAGHTACFG